MTQRRNEAVFCMVCPLRLLLFISKLHLQLPLLKQLLLVLEEIEEDGYFCPQDRSDECLNVVHRTQSVSLLDQLRTFVCANKDDGRMCTAAQFANGCCGLKTIHPRHSHVEKDDNIRKLLAR